LSTASGEVGEVAGFINLQVHSEQSDPVWFVSLESIAQLFPLRDGRIVKFFAGTGVWSMHEEFKEQGARLAFESARRTYFSLREEWDERTRQINSRLPDRQSPEYTEAVMNLVRQERLALGKYQETLAAFTAMVLGHK
jgi:hypothetical protein